MDDNERPPLLRLPAELRNEVYELVAGNEVVLFEGRVKMPETALLSVCQQSNREYAAVRDKLISTGDVTAHIHSFDGLVKMLMRISAPTRALNQHFFANGLVTSYARRSDDSADELERTSTPAQAPQRKLNIIYSLDVDHYGRVRLSYLTSWLSTCRWGLVSGFERNYCLRHPRRSNAGVVRICIEDQLISEEAVGIGGCGDLQKLLKASQHSEAYD